MVVRTESSEMELLRSEIQILRSDFPKLTKQVEKLKEKESLSVHECCDFFSSGLSLLGEEGRAHLDSHSGAQDNNLRNKSESLWLTVG